MLHVWNILPTFTNVGKYSIDGASGYAKVLNNTLQWLLHLLGNLVGDGPIILNDGMSKVLDAFCCSFQMTCGVIYIDCPWSHLIISG